MFHDWNFIAIYEASKLILCSDLTEMPICAVFSFYFTHFILEFYFFIYVIFAEKVELKNKYYRIKKNVILLRKKICCGRNLKYNLYNITEF